MNRFSLAFVMLIAIPGCAENDRVLSDRAVVENSSGALENMLAIDEVGACTFKGNVPNERICATTFYQLLAHPGRYDGAIVEILAWAIPGADGIVLYPTIDSLESAQVNAGILVRDPLVQTKLSEFLDRASASGEPVRFFITGKFEVARSGDLGRGHLYFAEITDIGEFGP